jgi:hypothetical protein
VPYGAFCTCSWGVEDATFLQIGGGRFDGTGYCFLEFPGRSASALQGRFFAKPPDVRLAEPDTQTFARKQAFATQRLRDWLDVGLS